MDTHSNQALNLALFFISQAVARLSTLDPWAETNRAHDVQLALFDGRGLPACTYYMAMELTDHKIRINAMSPLC